MLPFGLAKPPMLPMLLPELKLALGLRLLPRVLLILVPPGLMVLGRLSELLPGLTAKLGLEVEHGLLGVSCSTSRVQVCQLLCSERRFHNKFQTGFRSKECHLQMICQWPAV